MWTAKNVRINLILATAKKSKTLKRDKLDWTTKKRTLVVIRLLDVSLFPCCIVSFDL